MQAGADRELHYLGGGNRSLRKVRQRFSLAHCRNDPRGNSAGAERRRSDRVVVDAYRASCSRLSRDRGGCNSVGALDLLCPRSTYAPRRGGTHRRRAEGRLRRQLHKEQASVTGQPARGPAAGVDEKSALPEPDSREQRTYLTIRIIEHLARFGNTREDGTGRPEATQKGMAQSLSTSQGAISWILTRLLAAEAVHSQLSHVPGVGRRVRVYALTRRGELLSQEIETKTATHPPRAQF
jgi:hypothetical protein